MTLADSPLLGGSAKSQEAPFLCRVGALVLVAGMLLVGSLLASHLLKTPGHTAAEEVAFLRVHDFTLRSKLLDLDKRMEGRVVLPMEEDFPKACAVWNQISTLEPSPRAVIEVASERDVQLAMQLLPSLDLPFSIRSGGHSKAGYSNSPGGVIVSLKQLNNIQVIQNSGEGCALAKLGPAVTGPELLATSLPMGYSAVFGFCSSVAVGGFVLGGGWGVMSRKHGLGLDNILSANIVLASSEIIVTNSTHYTDLFWALRGAGIGNFGVVTEMTYRLHPAQKEMVCSWVTVPRAQAPAFLKQIASQDLPRELTLTLETVGEPMGFSVLWTCPEPNCLEYGKTFLQKKIATLVDGTQLKISPCTWPDMSFPSSGAPLVQSFTGFLKPANLTLENLQTIFDLYYEWVMDMGAYVEPDVELWGGRIADIPQDGTAFPHRDAVYNLGVVVEVPKDQPDFFEKIVQRLTRDWHRIGQFLDGAYVNYQMASLSSAEYAQAYWGTHVPRLQKIKRKYDPGNLFTYPQGIPVV